MATFKTGLKISLISAILLTGSMITTAQAGHKNHSILPYVAIGVFATILHHNSRSHSYKVKRKYGHSTHGNHGNHYGHSGYGNSHYHRNQHSHSSGAYSHQQKRH